MLVIDAQTEYARAKWHYRGQQRPDFAEPTGPDQESVWDYPRPPRIEAVDLLLQVRCDSRLLACTLSGVRVLETAGAPTYYFPPADVDPSLLVELPGRSVCEWKGPGVSFGLSINAEAPAQSIQVAWCYPETYPEFERIRGWYGFYPARLECRVGSERVTAQPGGYYGGWVTAGLKGPIKGEPGTEHW